MSFEVFNGWIHHNRRIISLQTDCKTLICFLRIPLLIIGPPSGFQEISRSFLRNFPSPHPVFIPTHPPLPLELQIRFSPWFVFPQIKQKPGQRTTVLHFLKPLWSISVYYVCSWKLILDLDVHNLFCQASGIGLRPKSFRQIHIHRWYAVSISPHSDWTYKTTCRELYSKL